jgi:exodeoxyribonuclease-5/deoxyribonuclease V
MGKKIAIDTYYYKDRAKTVGVVFNEWDDAVPEKILISWLSSDKYGPYIPGEFYKRELPCIMNLLEQIPDILDYDAIILDGLAHLPMANPEDKVDGLGIHLEQELNKKYPDFRNNHPTDPMKIYGPAIIGVAKTSFKGCDSDPGIAKIFRGTGKTPLYVCTTWFNMSSNDAGEAVKSMHGDYRIPTLLKILDKETKLDV